MSALHNAESITCVCGEVGPTPFCLHTGAWLTDTSVTRRVVEQVQRLLLWNQPPVAVCRAQVFVGFSSVVSREQAFRFSSVNHELCPMSVQAFSRVPRTSLSLCPANKPLFSHGPIYRSMPLAESHEQAFRCVQRTSLYLCPMNKPFAVSNEQAFSCVP